jgi:hypothetical protein
MEFGLTKKKFEIMINSNRKSIVRKRITKKRVSKRKSIEAKRTIKPKRK